MTIVDMMDSIAGWARDNVCAHIRLKKEPKTDELNTKNYQHELVNPKVWVLYRPTPDTLTRYDYDCPCIIVQPLKIRYDKTTGNISDATIRLECIAWSPGEYEPDKFEMDDTQLPPDQLGIYRQQAGNTFIPDDEGWRDAYNLCDLMLLKLMQTDRIKQLIIDGNQEIEASPFTEERVLQYFYPEYYMKIDFHVYTNESPLNDDARAKYL